MLLEDTQEDKRVIKDEHKRTIQSVTHELDQAEKVYPQDSKEVTTCASKQMDCIKDFIVERFNVPTHPRTEACTY